MRMEIQFLILAAIYIYIYTLINHNKKTMYKFQIPQSRLNGFMPVFARIRRSKGNPFEQRTPTLEPQTDPEIHVSNLYCRNLHLESIQ
jgi:hypothetical protein